MIHLPKKIIFLFLLFLLLFTFGKSLLGIVYAQEKGINTSSYNMKNYIEDNKIRTDEAEKGNTAIDGAGVAGFEYNALQAHITGSIVCMATDPKYCPEQTALGTVATLMAALYTHPPASGIAYTYDLLVNAGLLAKPAFAQGIGFAGLSPLLPIWKAARNIAYAVLIIVMIAVGFMIIFRMKIDPKTVISIQAALPKIVLTLVLITFSYAIVGFLIDLMYLTLAITINIMAQGMGGGFAKNVDKLQSQYMTGGVGTLGGAVFSGGLRSIDDFAKGFWGLFGLTGGTVGLAQMLFKAFSITAGAGAAGGYAILGVLIASGVFLLILVLGLLFTFIRLLMLLFNSYIQILIAVILGPILLLSEAIPGRSAFSGWIKNIIANLVVFPATAIILIFGMFLTTLNVTSPIWQPPLASLPTNAWSAFLGIGIIFMAPSLVASIKKIFHPKPAVPMTAGTAFAPLTGALQTGMGAGQSFYYMKSSLESLPVIGEKLRGGRR